MTCYNLNEYNNPVPVRSIRLNGRRISNPPDDLVISNGLGYPKQETPQPEYPENNPEKYWMNKKYELKDGVIVAVWEIKENPYYEPETSDSSTSESETEAEPSNQVEVEE